MTTSSTSAVSHAADTYNKPGHMDRTASLSGRPQRSKPHVRKYEVAYLHKNSDILDMAVQAPALPAFEDAFGALGHGAILQTGNGPMAVEDLLPGDQIRLANGDYDTLLWRGAMTIQPNDANANPENASLIRIMADALGLQRPSPDLVLGPTARLYHKANGIRALTGARAAFIPARDFVDGNHFIALRPAAPVRVYQLGFTKHQRLSVNGIPAKPTATPARSGHLRRWLGDIHRPPPEPPHQQDRGDGQPNDEAEPQTNRTITKGER